MVMDNYEGKRILLCNITTGLELDLVVVLTCLPHLSKSHRIKELIRATNQVPLLTNFIINVNSISDDGIH